MNSNIQGQAVSVNTQWLLDTRRKLRGTGVVWLQKAQWSNSQNISRREEVFLFYLRKIKQISGERAY